MAKSKKCRASGLISVRNAVTRILKKDETIDGKEYKAGTKMRKGSNCPNPDCKKFYPGVSKVIYCNVCGYRTKTLKPHELKKKLKRQKRMEYEKTNN